MRWEERLLDMFEDLEQQAQGLAMTERDVEVAELGRAEYASIDLASRVHASVGAEVVLELVGAGPIQGRLTRAGAGWCLLQSRDPAQEWLVPTAAVVAARGLSDLALTEPARALVARLGLGSALRSLAQEGEAVLVVRRDGVRTSGRIRRVGADFVELLLTRDGTGSVLLVQLGHVAAVRRG